VQKYMLYIFQEIIFWRVWAIDNFIRRRRRKGDNWHTHEIQNMSKWWSPLDTAVKVQIPQKVETSWWIQQLFINNTVYIVFRISDLEFW